MNFFKSSIFKFFIIFLLFITFLFFSMKNYSDYIFKNISNSFFRLHIIANSDSTEDQMIKYEIRDAILNYISPMLKNANSKDEAIQIIESNISSFYQLSNQVLTEHNVNYPVTISTGNFLFPTKDYSTFTLPEGHYDALKIELGNASGQNWWCVMFPSVCLINPGPELYQNPTNEILESTLESEELSLITDKSNSLDIKFKFKLLEFFENL